MAIDNKYPVLTPHGFINHGDLEAGDYVYNLEGEAVRVISVSAEVPTDYVLMVGQHYHQCIPIVCSGDHLWPIQRNATVVATRTTLQLLKLKMVMNDVPVLPLLKKERNPAILGNPTPYTFPTSYIHVSGTTGQFGRSITIDSPENIYLIGRYLVPTT